MNLRGARKRVGGDPTVKQANRRKHSAAEQVQRDVSTALDQPPLMSSVHLRPGQSHSWVDTSDEFPDPLPPVSVDVSDVNDNLNRMAIPHPSDFQVTFLLTIRPLFDITDALQGDFNVWQVNVMEETEFGQVQEVT